MSADTENGDMSDSISQTITLGEDLNVGGDSLPPELQSGVGAVPAFAGDSDSDGLTDLRQRQARRERTEQVMDSL